MSEDASVTSPTTTDATIPGPVSPDGGTVSDASVSSPDAGPSSDAPAGDGGSSDAARLADASSRYNQLELGVSGRLMIGDSPQLEARFSYRPTRIFSLGLSFNTTLISRFGGAAHASLRGDITPNIAFEPRFYAGLLGLNNLTRDTGPLAERVTLNGLSFFAMLDLNFSIRPIDGLLLALGPSLMMEVPVDVRSNPASLVSGENPNGGVRFYPGFSASVSWETLPNRPSPPVEDDASRRRAEPPPPSLPPPPPTLDQRVDAVVAQIEERRRAEAQERIRGVVHEISGQHETLQTSLDHLGDGINRTNQMAQRLDENADRLEAARATLTADQQDQVRAQLTALSTATQLNGTELASTTDESEDIRYGLRFIYSTTTVRNVYGRRIERLLENLVTRLRSHGHTELADQAGETLTGLRGYLDHHTGAHTDHHFETGVLRMEDFRTEAASIENSMQQVETLERDYNLASNPDWMALRQALNGTQQQIREMTRTGDALGALAFIFQGTTNNFGDQVRTPAQASATMRRAMEFLTTDLAGDRYRIQDDPPANVTLEGLQRRYGDYFQHLSYNLSTFIALHTPPAMVTRRDRIQWFEAVSQARELLCRIDRGNARCAETLENPGSTAGGTSTAETPRQRQERLARESEERARRAAARAERERAAAAASTSSGGTGGTTGSPPSDPPRRDPPPLPVEPSPRPSGGRDAGVGSSPRDAGVGSSGSSGADAGTRRIPPPPSLPAESRDGGVR